MVVNTTHTSFKIKIKLFLIVKRRSHFYLKNSPDPEVQYAIAIRLQNIVI